MFSFSLLIPASPKRVSFFSLSFFFFRLFIFPSFSFLLHTKGKKFFCGTIFFFSFNNRVFFSNLSTVKSEDGLIFNLPSIFLLLSSHWITFFLLSGRGRANVTAVQISHFNPKQYTHEETGGKKITVFFISIHKNLRGGLKRMQHGVECVWQEWKIWRGENDRPLHSLSLARLSIDRTFLLFFFLYYFFCLRLQSRLNTSAIWRVAHPFLLVIGPTGF